MSDPPDDRTDESDEASDDGGLADIFEDSREEPTIDESRFTEQDSEDLDAADVWTAIETDAEGAAGAAADVETAAPDAVEGVDADVESEPTDVVDSGVCHGCPYFGEPPTVHCTHDGTEIREVVDGDRYLVVACPVVRDDVEE